jgi:hypothetical protein
LQELNLQNNIYNSIKYPKCKLLYGSTQWNVLPVLSKLKKKKKTFKAEATEVAETRA